MSDGITIMIGEDGVAREYNDTYDIVIHCESEEDRKKAIERINNSIPCDFINSLINDPANAGSKSRVLSWLLGEWEKEHERP